MQNFIRYCRMSYEQASPSWFYSVKLECQQHCSCSSTHLSVGCIAHAGLWEYILQVEFLVLMQLVLFHCVLMDIFANLSVCNLALTVYKCKHCYKKIQPKNDLQLYNLFYLSLLKTLCSECKIVSSFYSEIPVLM